MLIVPIQTPNHEQDALLLVLGPENIDRMQQGDPAEIELRRTGKTLVNPTILVCYEKPSAELNRLIQGGNIEAIIKFLQRGWKFRPDKGDHDRGPESIHKSN